LSHLVKDNYDFEHIYTDNDSQDSTFDLLSDLAGQNSNVKIIRFSRNIGADKAIVFGLQHAKGDAVILIQADLQDPPELILQMLPAWESGSLLTICSRRSRVDPLVTRTLSKIYYRLIRRIVSPSYPVDGGDVFLIDRSLVHHLTSSSKTAYLQMLIHWLGYSPTYIPYDRESRLSGKSTWSLKKRIATALDVLLNFSATPIHVASLLCLIVSAMGFVYSVILIVVALTKGGEVPGYTGSLIFSSSFLICLSIASAIQGEYLIRVWGELNRQPEVVVRSVSIQSTSSEAAK